MIYRQKLEDFRVTELPLYPLRGEGDFWYVRVLKQGVDSVDVIESLASAAGCASRDVGMAGRKDRWAVTEQWFSIPVRGCEFPRLDLEGAEILEVERHHERLRTGQLAGNRFDLVVRDVPDSAHREILKRVSEAREQGFANRFGVQRFGRDGDNAERGLEILKGERSVRDRRAARFFVSALQSQLFNASLELRRTELGLATLVDGDLALVHRTGGLFWIDSGSAEQARADALELSATGPLFGEKMRRPFAKARRWEEDALQDAGLNEQLFQSRRGLRINGTRRPIRALVPDLQVSIDQNQARVSVTLGPGSYASVLLEELFGSEIQDARRQDQTLGSPRLRQNSRESVH